MLFLHEANVHLLGGVSTGEVTTDIHVIVTYDASNDVSRRDAFSPLSRNKSARILHRNTCCSLAISSISILKSYVKRPK